MYADIIPITKLPSKRNQLFSYLVPSSMESDISFGSIVDIPFGRQHLKGVVVDTSESTAQNATKIKSITRTYPLSPRLTAQQYQLALWMHDFYYAPLSFALKLCIPRWMNPKNEVDNKKNTPVSAERSRLLSEDLILLSSTQQYAWEEISKHPSSAFLLHGVTGSGKTEIYTKALRHAMSQGQQGLFLIPEISLTSQFMRHLRERFGNDSFVVFHSKMTAKERGVASERIARGDVSLVLGPRSTLFVPFKKLGCIIMDEEHDSSYKQYDQSPRYHARDVALKLGEIWKCPVILGSATPSLESYYAATKSPTQSLKLISLNERFVHDKNVIQKDLPTVEIIDMREELRRGNRLVISDRMAEAIQQTLDDDEQVILFLNRRGMSTIVMCRDCGYVVKCPHCDIPFVYHISASSTHNLFCHHCDARDVAPLSCPQCKSPAIKFFGTGTERIELEIKKLFPSIRITRMDADTTRGKESHHELIEQFREHKTDILIGTQMIGKGLDLPNVNLVGIISVDNLLHMPDFRSSELVFELLTQVAGRSGRRNKRGHCILQTYTPRNPIIEFASRHDFEGFAREELQDREALFYPPYARVIKLVITHKKNDRAKEIAQSLGTMLRATSEKIGGGPLRIELLGPSPGFIPRKQDKYFWHIIIKYDPNINIAPLLALVPDEWIVDVDPFTLL